MNETDRHEAFGVRLIFPLFALNQDDGPWLMLHRDTGAGVLPLFSSIEWAEDFARRFDLDMEPWPLVRPHDLSKALLEFRSLPESIVVDPVEPTISDGVPTIRCQSFVDDLGMSGD